MSVALLLRNNRRFPEITGEDNLTVFSYSGRVQSPEWRWQRRRADLRHFEIFRHGHIIIYTRLPAPHRLSDLHVLREQWVFDRHFWCLFCLLFTGIRHIAHVLTVPPTKACLLCATPAGMDLNIQVHARRLLPSAVPWISEDRLLKQKKSSSQSPAPHPCSWSLLSCWIRGSGQLTSNLLISPGLANESLISSWQS